MVIALAGRRIDDPASGARRFPLENVPLVRERLDALFAREGGTALVASAACGADLVALGVAAARGMRRRVVLPFGREAFRETSVTDRPGDWGPIYDAVLADVALTGDVVELRDQGRDAPAYQAANEAILREAAALAGSSAAAVLAVVVWEGAPRGSDDLTAAFADAARARGLRVESVSTL